LVLKEIKETDKVDGESMKIESIDLMDAEDLRGCVLEREELGGKRKKKKGVPMPNEEPACADGLRWRTPLLVV